MPSICHAPRERVSWNQILPLFCLSNWRHAPRERVSWNLNISRAAIQLSRHAPRERVSWNKVVACGCTCFFVTLHVSVWVEIKLSADNEIVVKSRSTWACELKCQSVTIFVRQFCHAPRERVSWNFTPTLSRYCLIVTLHVSVWVEMKSHKDLTATPKVTLHVSVWVEIYRRWHFSCWKQSRSTWACELK